MSLFRNIQRNARNLPNFVRELLRIPQAIQEGRQLLNANPVTYGGLYTDVHDVKQWSHATSPPPADQDDFQIIKQQWGLYVVEVGDFCFCGDGSIWHCTDATPGALVWEQIAGPPVSPASLTYVAATYILPDPPFTMTEVMYNTLGVTITVTRPSGGVVRYTASSPIFTGPPATAGAKTAVLATVMGITGGITANLSIGAQVVSTTVVEVYEYDSANMGIDGEHHIRIDVYP